MTRLIVLIFLLTISSTIIYNYKCKLDILEKEYTQRVEQLK